MIIPISTLMGAGGAVIGGVGGALANAQRIKDQDKSILEGSKKLQYLVDQKTAAVDSATSEIDLAAIAATDQMESAGVGAAQGAASMEAKAAMGGAKGGTPFYKLGAAIADSSAAIASLSRMNRTKFGAMESGVKAQMEGYDMQIGEVNQAVANMEHNANYLSSPLAWGMSVATGAMSGAATANSISTGLESLGFDMTKGIDFSALAKESMLPDVPTVPSGDMVGRSISSPDGSFDFRSLVDPTMAYGSGTPAVFKPFDPADRMSMRYLAPWDSSRMLLSGMPRSLGPSLKIQPKAPNPILGYPDIIKGYPVFEQ